MIFKTATPIFLGENARNEKFKIGVDLMLGSDWEKKAADNREKLRKEKGFKKQHLTFTSNGLYTDFNTFLYMLQYEYGIIIDDSIIEDTGEVFIYHIKCSYNKALKLKVYKDSNNIVYMLEILGV